MGRPLVQLTALDRPHLVNQIGPPWDPVGRVRCRVGTANTCSSYFDDFEAWGYGFDENFFESVLYPVRPAASELRVENYYAESNAVHSWSGVGGQTNGLNVYNHVWRDSSGDEFGFVNPHDLAAPFFVDELTSVELGKLPLGEYSNDHSGVHQWYRWSMDSNVVADLRYHLAAGGAGADESYFAGLAPPWIVGAPPCSGADFDNRPYRINGGGPFHPSLSPCAAGWSLSPFAANQSGTFPGRTLDVAFSTVPVPMSQMVDAVVRAPGLEDFDGDGQTETVFRCVEASSPFGTASVTVPDESEYLEFFYPL